MSKWNKYRLKDFAIDKNGKPYLYASFNTYGLRGVQPQKKAVFFPSKILDGGYIIVPKDRVDELERDVDWKVKFPTALESIQTKEIDIVPKSVVEEIEGMPLETDKFSLLSQAIQVENDSVIFYQNLMEIFPEWREVLQDITNEELKHIGQLEALRNEQPQVGQKVEEGENEADAQMKGIAVEGVDQMKGQMNYQGLGAKESYYTDAKINAAFEDTADDLMRELARLEGKKYVPPKRIPKQEPSENNGPDLADELLDLLDDDENNDASESDTNLSDEQSKINNLSDSNASSFASHLQKIANEDIEDEVGSEAYIRIYDILHEEAEDWVHARIVSKDDLDDNWAEQFKSDYSLEDFIQFISGSLRDFNIVGLSEESQTELYDTFGDLLDEVKYDIWEDYYGDEDEDDDWEDEEADESFTKDEAESEDPEAKEACACEEYSEECTRLALNIEDAESDDDLANCEAEIEAAHANGDITEEEFNYLFGVINSKH